MQSQPHHQREVSGKYHIPATLSRENELCYSVVGHQSLSEKFIKEKNRYPHWNRHMTIHNFKSHYSD